MTDERIASNVEHHRLAGRILGALHLLTRGQIVRMSYGALADHIAFRLRQESDASQPVTEEQVDAEFESILDAEREKARQEERKRCAEIARTSWWEDGIVREVCEAIAARIREGEA